MAERSPSRNRPVLTTLVAVPLALASVLAELWLDEQLRAWGMAGIADAVSQVSVWIPVPLLLLCFPIGVIAGLRVRRVAPRWAPGNPPPDALVQTAFHEAAHFVVMHRLGLGEPRSITIVAEGTTAGRVMYVPPPSSAEDARYQDVCTWLLAGYWGDVFTGLPQLVALQTAQHDYAAVDRVLRSRGLAGIHMESAVGHMQIHAMLAVREHWPAIDALARALLRAGTLRRAAAVAALEGAAPLSADEVSRRIVAGFERSSAGDAELQHAPSAPPAAPAPPGLETAARRARRQQHHHRRCP